VPYWACAQTAPQREAAAKHFLELAGYQVYLPRFRLLRPIRGRKVVEARVLFPAYLFVWVTAGWWAARWCPHVARLLTAGDGPLHVPDAIVDEIRQREVDGLIELPKPGPLQRGDRVRILHGPFRDHLAIFADMKPRQRVEVLLQLLGAEARVTLAEKDIEAVATQDAVTQRPFGREHTRPPSALEKRVDEGQLRRLPPGKHVNLLRR
jgi:transcriptional antiterminator RfaH